MMNIKTLTKDLGATSKRISKNQALLDELSLEDKKALQEKLLKYSPKSDEAKEFALTAVGFLEIAIAAEGQTNGAAKNSGVSKPKKAKTQAPVIVEENFDSAAVGKTLQVDTAVLEMHIRQPGFTKKISPDELMKGGEHVGKVDTKTLRAGQTILEGEELDALMAHRSQFVKFIKSITANCSMLAPGMYLIRLSRVDEMTQKIETFITERRALLDKLEAAFPALQEKAKEMRGDFYDENDYLPFDQYRVAYRVDWRYLSFNVPAALEQMNKTIYERENAKLEAQFASAAEEMRDTLRLQFQKQLDHLLDRLASDGDGKMKQFHGTRITALQEFAATFADKDLTGDETLARLARQTADILNGVDIKELRKDVSVRESLASAFSAIHQEVESLQIISPTRKFNLADD